MEERADRRSKVELRAERRREHEGGAGSMKVEQGEVRRSSEG